MPSSECHIATTAARLLLAHGRLDSRVDVKHAQRMRSALKDRRVDVEYFEMPQTGHSILLERYQHEFYARLLNFFDRHIGKGANGTAALARD